MWKVDLAEQGKGYATEIMSAITQWFDTTPHAARTVCMIDPANDASIRVASRLGFREFDRVEYRGSPVNLYERVRG
jgi:RimJ/RimL family protein N-acetyltransferase